MLSVTHNNHIYIFKCVFDKWPAEQQSFALVFVEASTLTHYKAA